MAPEDKAAELQRIINEERAKSAELQSDMQALREEFANADTYDETVAVARKGIANMLELAVTTAERLLANATSESVQSSMSKFVIETVLSGKLDAQPEGEIRELIKRLAGNDKNFKEQAQAIVDSSTNTDQMPEPLLLVTPIGLNSIGSEFNTAAPFTGCRLCGDLFQHAEDRKCYEKMLTGVIAERRLMDGTSIFVGPEYYMDMIDRCTLRRKRWVEKHNSEKHSNHEIESFAKHADKTGQAFTAEAAHKLGPFGITPLVSGSDDPEIVDALAKAPRAPNELERSQVTKHAEIIFETGAHSIVSYDDVSEIEDFLSEHTRRVEQGEFGATQDWEPRTDIEPELAAQADRVASRPAERVHQVLLYSEHPIDLHSNTVNSETVKNLIDGMTIGGEFNHEQLIQALRDEASPVYPQDQNRLSSIYKAQEDNELDLSFLDGGTDV